MKNKTRLYINQYGEKYFAKSIKELRRKVENGGSRVSKMYIDRKDGNETIHIGYVIGKHWLTAYAPVEIPAC